MNEFRVAAVSLAVAGMVLAGAGPVPAGSGGTAGNQPGGPAAIRARVTGRAFIGTPTTPLVRTQDPGATPAPSRSQQIRVLRAALTYMHKHYAAIRNYEPGPVDVFDYGVGSLWRKGIDGAGTTVAVIEGWNYRPIGRVVAAFDKAMHLPDPRIQVIFPSGDGKLPAKCPPGMARLGQYGSCAAWAGELTLDVLSVHLMAPYAKILISVTPADSEITDDAASQVAPPEMMRALDRIASQHLANVISISDGSAEASYHHGAEEITAQDPGELATAAAGIPVLVSTGDGGAVQVLPSYNGGVVTATPDTATWDDSPWVTAVGGTTPNFWYSSGRRRGPDPLWPGSGAGYSAVFARPAYQGQAARRTASPMRSVPDLVMDSWNGTSESAPILGGVLALATQLNHRDIGPINPVLYTTLGPAGAADGIIDITTGNNSAGDVPGFSATRGFDIASGWGTIYAPRFVPSLVTATRNAHQEQSARHQARAELAFLTSNLTLSPATLTPHAISYLLAPGFLPGHPVSMLIDGRRVAKLTASPLGYVTYIIKPARLALAPGRHTVTLKSMLITESKTFRISAMHQA